MSPASARAASDGQIVFRARGHRATRRSSPRSDREWAVPRGRPYPGYAVSRLGPRVGRPVMATNERFMPVHARGGVGRCWRTRRPTPTGSWAPSVIRDIEPGLAAARGPSSTTPSAPARSRSMTTPRSWRPSGRRLLKLRAKGRPAGTALVTHARCRRSPQANGTVVQMTENPDGAFAHLSLNPADPRVHASPATPSR